MNVLDLILLACLVPAVIRGFSKGFIDQLVALLTVIIGIWISFRCSGLASGWLLPYLNEEVSPAVVQVIAFVLIMLAVALLLHLVGKAVKAILKFVLLGWVDRLLGIVFALIKAGVVIGLVVMLFNTLNAKLELVRPEILENSVLYGPIKDITYAIFPYFKELLVK